MSERRLTGCRRTDTEEGKTLLIKEMTQTTVDTVLLHHVLRQQEPSARALVQEAEDPRDTTSLLWGATIMDVRIPRNRCSSMSMHDS